MGDGGEQPDAGEGDTPEWGDEDRDEQKTGGGGAGVTGSNATASLSKARVELKSLLNVDVGDNMDFKDVMDLLEVVKKCDNPNMDASCAIMSGQVMAFVW